MFNLLCIFIEDYRIFLHTFRTCGTCKTVSFYLHDRNEVRRTPEKITLGLKVPNSNAPNTEAKSNYPICEAIVTKSNRTFACTFEENGVSFGKVFYQLGINLHITIHVGCICISQANACRLSVFRYAPMSFLWFHNDFSNNQAEVTYAFATRYVLNTLQT